MRPRSAGPSGTVPKSRRRVHNLRPSSPRITSAVTPKQEFPIRWPTILQPSPESKDGVRTQSFIKSKVPFSPEPR